MGDAGAEQRVLARLGLARLAITDQLVLVLKRFRAAQLRDLEAALAALPDAVVAHVEAHFDRKLDVKDELERYVQDLLKATHLARHLQLDGAAQREIETLLAALGDGGDRALLLKMLQALGARLARVLCAFCVQLPHIKLQQDFYRVFAGTDPGVGELKAWMQWLDSVASPAREGVDEFLIKATMERCLAQWLTLLAPLGSPQRVAVIQRLAKADASLLKQIGRFHEVTALPVTKLLELCDTFRTELALVLAEFPMATTLTLYAKFNNDRLIATVIKAMYLLGKGEVIRLVDALAVEDNLRAIQAFFISMIEYERSRSVSSLYLRLSKLSQSRLVELTLRAASVGEEQEEGDPSIAFQFVLEGQLRSMDDVLRKLTSLPAEITSMLMKAMQRYSVDELVLLGEGIEAIADLHCLDRFFRLFDMLLPEQRTLLVDWVHDVPGEEAVLLYDKLFQFHSSAALDKAASLLQMMSSLKKSDKIALCVRLLHAPSQDQEKSSIEATNDGVLKYLCDCEPSRRHKSIKLLDATDHAAFDTLLFLLRTQRMPEQVALTKVMLSLSPDANGRLLAKLNGLDGETLDEFFQLLMLIPKIEYNKLARLLVSPEVNLDQFQTFVHVAANMMNQAASREIVIFTADLPPRYRNMFFEMLAQCTPAEKGVVMRIVACSTRLSPDVLHLFVELQLRIPWETRSALVEQLRALEESADIQTYVLVLRGFDEDACLPRMVHLLNLLPLPVRISLVPLFARINSIPERVQALGKLNAMRKDRMPPYCTALSAPLCLHVISCNYLRVFGYLQDEYQIGMLQLLEWKSCWVFIEVLAAAMDAAIASSSSTDSITVNTTLVNGLAASLTLLKLEDDFVLLGDVMEEAMENGTRLEELIVVFAYFRDRERLLALLKYVSHLTRYSRSTLFFRVLSRSKETAFLFDMCHVLDLDDALFALKRLDRMCLRDGSGVEKMLSQMAQGAAVDSRDEFCHLVLGYRERLSTYPATPSHVADRVIEPRIEAHDDLLRQLPTSSSSSSLETVPDDDDRFDIDVASVSPASLRQIVVNKQLERVQDKRELARRRRRCRNWREWTQADWRDVMVANREGAANDPQAPSVVAGISLEQADEELTERRSGSEDPATLHDEVGHGVFDAVSTSTNCVQDVSEACPEVSKRDPRAGTVLPLIARPTQAIDDSKRPPSGHNNRPLYASTAHPDTTRALTRSESAPVALDQKTRNDSKKYRGLQAALGLDEADVQHAQRGRGASIFHSQCKLVIEQGPSRIRVAHTEEAHAKVLAARVDHALGRRADTSSFVVPVEKSLRRSERCAIERAAQAISLSKRDRSRGVQDFLKRGSDE